MTTTLTVKVKHVVLVLAAVFILYLFLHYGKKNNAVTLPAPMVVVKKPILAKVTEYVTQTGTTVAFNSVDLVARVEGYLREINFVDGSVIKKGQSLFVIQPEPYYEQLEEAKAAVAAEKAGYDYAKSEYARQTRMYKENATSLNNVEKWLAKTYESQANLNKAVANQKIAEINYSYTHIASPFDGRIGRHLIDIGNLVGHGSATNLATIQQIDTLYVYFNLNELDLIKLREAARNQGLTPKDIDTIIVNVKMQNAPRFTDKARLNFINTGLNASTGTMELRALMDNKNHKYVPGLFVEVRIPISQPSQQLTVIDTAIQYDQIGAYLLIADASNKVVLKRVELGSAEEGMRAITKGINADDRVIINGLQNAIEGNQVQAKEA